MRPRFRPIARGLLLLCGLFSAFPLFLHAQTPVATHGQLRVEGNRIVDAGGTPTQFKGMSLFWSQWMPQYYTSGTVDWLADDWNCSVVRAAMAVDEGGYAVAPDREQAKVETVVDAAIAAGVYVIIDFHTHHAEDYLPQAKRFFGDMARKYGDSPNVIYEIYNEPLNVSWSGTIKPYALEVIDVIRQHDPDNIIVVGTRQWSQKVSEAAADPIRRDNIAYTLHFYAGTHGQWLRDEAQQALDAGLALFVTEYGTTLASGDGAVFRDETRQWWDFLDQRKISHANWSIADKREGSAALEPGASGNGGWPLDEVTESGRFVREELRAGTPADGGGDDGGGDDGGGSDPGGEEPGGEEPTDDNDDTTCSNPQPVALNFAYDGTGTRCWTISDNIRYVNSWNTDRLTINGEDFTNTWSNQLPPRIDGNYYVSYTGSLPWSHFEAVGRGQGRNKSVSAVALREADIYPNPFAGESTLSIPDPEGVTKLQVLDVTGRELADYGPRRLNSTIRFGADWASGIYFLRLHTATGQQTLRVVKY